MPYVTCPRCGLHTFTAARWSNVDHCDRCDAELPRVGPGAKPDDRDRFPKEALTTGPDERREQGPLATRRRRP
jgi:hypothetical protein